jgi:phosphoadenosine phosphosulfate reductase
MVLKMKRDIPVLSIVTPFKPVETTRFRMQIVKLMNLNYREVSGQAVGELYKEDPEKCCEHYKVAPLKEALKPFSAWITGIRSTEGLTRSNIKPVQETDGLTKINPLCFWNEVDVWKYIAMYNVPINPLYLKGYRSLGCAPCSVLVDDDKDERSGRWHGTCKEAGECGIHSKSMRK